MFKRLISTALIFGAAALAPPTTAQQALRCMPRDVLTKTLDSKYNETLTGGGLQTEKRLIEVWSSPDTGSFTIFLTRPDGVSCVLATGQNWNSVQPPPPPGVTG
ncbi:hypothetical protein PGB28_04140 [Primorskyibacter aestuariivivens]|uniref:hypothetical protein n=1 Tax=Primorskyibacter aestuariivivens TaxID=1888912 RepID=UPI002300DD81|nr:hypothetical protein [Primorskyibacter aestuariivivens]MDA7427636.1 hypothetical protein [Primorskyibacter aestuariivivens]